MSENSEKKIVVALPFLTIAFSNNGFFIATAFYVCF